MIGFVRAGLQAVARMVLPYEYGQGFHDGYEAALFDLGLDKVREAPAKEDVYGPKPNYQSPPRA